MHRLEWSEMCLRAMQISMAVHSGHKDKSGMTYFWHPLRVANSMKGWRLQTVALLHDVIEDGMNMPADIMHLLGIPESVTASEGNDMTGVKLHALGITDMETLEAVKVLTRNKGELYSDYLKRVKENNLARIVKLADINDNMSVERLSYLGVHKAMRMLTKYWAAMRFLRDIDPETVLHEVGYDDIILQEAANINKKNINMEKTDASHRNRHSEEA